MGEVLHVQFGTEREWETTRTKTVEGLVAIGELFGDDEALMRAKAERLYQMLREIVEDVPTVRINATLPASLEADEMESVTLAVKDATLKGIEAAMTHSVQVMMAGIYDLCTSKLRNVK